MKEELTTKQHEEFQIAEELQLSHRVHSAHSLIKSDIPKDELFKMYRITQEQYDKYHQRYI